MPHPTLRSQELASSLLANPSHNVEDDMGRVLQRLHVVIGRLAGVTGSFSLMARALHLAKVEVPWLGTFQITDEGLLSGSEEGVLPRDPAMRRQGGVIPVAHVIELLHTFIGERLTLQLIKEAWPDQAIFDDDDLKDIQP